MSPPPSRRAYLASTVLLVRDQEGPEGTRLEVFMEKRHIKSDFVGGAYVFPGGRVDEADGIDPELCAGLDEESANLHLGLDGGGLAHYVAAIRECFEEAGVLLAYDHSGDLLDFSQSSVEDRYRDLRDRMNRGEVSLQDMTRREGLRLATDRMAYWSHWITPEGQPRIYDTRFFIAHAPDKQTATHDDWELTSSAWVTPGEAIEHAMRREWMISFPTLVNLRQLSRFATADEAVRWAREQRRPLPVNQPRVHDGRVVLPGEDGYEQAERDVSRHDPKIFFTSFRP